ncbi:MAG TPA: hypothetical protein VE986_05390 [Hyphomicrobiales bacterium]|nr:hypothetical protein [Hyphomicrobiales bacterium]
MRPPRIICDENGLLWCPHCGAQMSRDERSLAHHGGFFAFLEYSFENWPETYQEFQPINREHLRGWALVEAGHKSVQEFRFSTRTELEMAAAIVRTMMAQEALSGRFSRIETVRSAKMFNLIRPASIKFEKLGQRKFNEISEAVSGIVKNITGIGFDEWKAMDRHINKAPRRRDGITIMPPKSKGLTYA